jgi:hypothetical protein
MTPLDVRGACSTGRAYLCKHPDERERILKRASDVVAGTVAGPWNRILSLLDSSVRVVRPFSMGAQQLG